MLAILDIRSNTEKCSDCKHRLKPLVWKPFRLDIYQDYPDPCSNCLFNVFTRYPYYEKEITE